MVIFSVVVVLAIFLLIWYWGDKYPQFDGTFDPAIAIPGLEEGATPQGITNYSTAEFKVETENGEGEKTTATFAADEYFFISAYHKNAPSRIYVVGKATGYKGYVTVKNVHEDGKDDSYYTGHCGGIATNGYFLWVCSNENETDENGNQKEVGYIYCAKTTDKTYDYKIGREIIAKATENGGEISFTSKFNANGKASFLYYYSDGRYTQSYNELQGDKLYVGEFYRAGNYETDESHHGETKLGDTNRALVYEYSVNTSTTMTNESNVTGLTCLTASNLAAKFANRVPTVQSVYSIPDEIQGFARIHHHKTQDNGTDVLEDTLVLSQSYGLKNSRLYYYDWSKLTASANSETYQKFNAKGKSFVYEGVTTRTNAPATEKNLNLSTVKVYFIDGNLDYNKNTQLLNDYSIPSMSEGLCVSGSRVYVLFESGASQYRIFVRRIIKDVYSFVPKESEKRRNADIK